MKDKKKPTAGKTPAEHVITCGQISAHIHRRQSNTGYSYLDFSLTRTWASQTTGRDQTGPSMFEYHEASAVEAVRRACDWIRQQNSQAGDDGEPPVAQEAST